MLAKARALAEGRPRSETRALREVNAPMIEHWCGVMGMAPVRRNGTLVAPPAMLSAWVAGGDERVRGSGVASVGELLRSRGFGSVAALRFEQSDLREVVVGDLLVARTAVSSVAEDGEGFEVVLDKDFEDVDGKLVATQRMLLGWTSGQAAVEVALPPAEGASGPLGGDRLAPFTSNVDAALIARGAVAARDDFAAHVDHHVARALGYPDLIMSLYTMSGIVGCHASRAAGPRMRQAGQVLEVFRHTLPGQRLRFDASIRRDEATATVEALVRSDDGLHVRARTTFEATEREGARLSASRT